MKRKYIAITLLITALTTILPITSASASGTGDTVIEYVEDNDEESVNIVDLARQLGEEIKEVKSPDKSNGVEFYLNGKKIDIYDDYSYIYVDTSMVPLKSFQVKDTETGKMNTIAISRHITKSGDGYLIPTHIAEDILGDTDDASDISGVTYENDGIHISKSVVKKSTKPLTPEEKQALFIEEADKKNGVVKSDIKVTNPSSKADNTRVGSFTTELGYSTDNTGQVVNIEKLAETIGEEVIKTGDGIEVYLNGKKVTINYSTGYAYVDNVLVYDKATKVKGIYLIPRSVVQDKLGFSCDLYHLIIKREVKSDGSVKVTSISEHSTNGYEPYYDYDFADYAYAYADKHGLLIQAYDQNLVNTLRQEMQFQRQKNTNEGWHTKDGKFYFLVGGVPKTGWYKDVTTWYYFNKDGSMYTDWLNDNGNRYYFYDSGAMARNCYVGNYYLNENGALTNNVPANASTGISYEELNNRVRSLGFKHKRYFTSEELGGSEAGYGYYWKEDTLNGDSISIGDSGSFSVSITKNNAEANKAIKQIFDWLLPTQGDKLQNIISNKPTNQTLTMDGRTVTIKLYQGSISVTIKG